MTLDIKQLRERWSHKFNLAADAPVGVAASFGQNVTVDTDKGNRDITVVFNTDDMDLDDEVVLPGGGDMSYVLANGKVFADHQYDIEHTIGTIRHIVAHPGKGLAQRSWRARVRMDTSPLAAAVLRFAQAGSIGASVGFVADDVSSPSEDEAKRFGKGGRKPRSIVRKWRALEFSFTAMPCNVGCQSLAVHACDDDVKRAAIDRLVTKGVVDPRLAADIGYRGRKPRTIAFDDGLVVRMGRS